MRVGRRFLLAAVAGVLASVWLGVPPALALDLDAAKAQGWIGERRDGYLRPTPEWINVEENEPGR